MLLGDWSKGRRTLEAITANDNVPKKYQIRTNIKRFLFLGFEHERCQIYTLNHEKCTDLVLFWLHTQIDKKESVVL